MSIKTQSIKLDGPAADATLVPAPEGDVVYAMLFHRDAAGKVCRFTQPMYRLGATYDSYWARARQIAVELAGGAEVTGADVAAVMVALEVLVPRLGGPVENQAAA
jgi:hypothetical protein